MRRPSFSRPANRSLLSILEYLTRQSGSADIGIAFTKRLQQKCEHLASLPGTMGRDRSELQPGLRSVAFRNYVIFFRYREDRFEVVNILEGHRDVQEALDDDTE